jgi:hypothetical protein
MAGVGVYNHDPQLVNGWAGDTRPAVRPVTWVTRARPQPDPVSKSPWPVPAGRGWAAAAPRHRRRGGGGASEGLCARVRNWRGASARLRHRMAARGNCAVKPECNCAVKPECSAVSWRCYEALMPCAIERGKREEKREDGGARDERLSTKRLLKNFGGRVGRRPAKTVPPYITSPIPILLFAPVSVR